MTAYYLLCGLLFLIAPAVMVAAVRPWKKATR